MRRLHRTLTVGLGSVTACLLAGCINELPVDMREGDLQTDTIRITPGARMVGFADVYALDVTLNGVPLTGLRARWEAVDSTALAVRSLAGSLEFIEGMPSLEDSLLSTLFGEISYLRRGTSNFIVQFDSVGLAGVFVDTLEVFVEERWQAVSAGSGHTCAATLANTFQNSLQHRLRRGGEVFCWGEGIFGALGTGSLDLRDTPSRALSDVTFRDVRGGSGYTCGRDTTGLLYCWGDNFNGQLGLGNDLDQFVPRLIALGEAFTSFDVGKSDQFTCATRAKEFEFVDDFNIDTVSPGATLCWGQNDRGQLGCGGPAAGTACDSLLTQTNTAELTAVSSDTDVLYFASLSVGGDHACGVEDITGTVYCWGSNDSGQLGLDPITAASGFAVAFPGPPSVFEEVAAGLDFTCGIGQGRTAVSCWGATLGQPGAFSHLPTPVAGLPGSGLHSLSAGGGHACVLTTDAEAYCWGDNSSGQLGGSPQGPMTAVAVAGDHEFGVISAGEAHTCAITDEPFELSGRGGSELPIDLVPSSGAIYCWGDNSIGQLGNPGAVNSSSVPVRVFEPEEDF